jgi:hypothetical protein
MADYDALTYFHLTGLYNGIVADSSGLFGDPGPQPDLYNVNMDVNIALSIAGANGRPLPGAPELRLTTATPPRTLLLLPILAHIESGVLRLPGADTAANGVDLVARSPILGIPDTAQFLCQVNFGQATIGGGNFQFDPVTFVVPTVLPADYHPNVVQTISILASPDGGNYTLIYGETPTVNLPWNSTLATVQAALRAIAAIGNNVTLSGPAAGPIAGTVTATFNTAAIPRPLRLGQHDNLTSTAHTFPSVVIADTFTPTTVDLTTVDRYVIPAA